MNIVTAISCAVGWTPTAGFHGQFGFSIEVDGRVGGRQRLGDDELGRGESEQHQHHDLARPARDEPREHPDRALPLERPVRDVAVDRQRAEERDEDQDDGRERCEQAGVLVRDRRLVAERGEVIDAGQAHHPQPERLMVRLGRFRWRDRVVRSWK